MPEISLASEPNGTVSVLCVQSLNCRPLGVGSECHSADCPYGEPFGPLDSIQAYSHPANHPVNRPASHPVNHLATRQRVAPHLRRLGNYQKFYLSRGAFI